jgi:uncharacterized protein YbaP (TraB family)
LLQTLIPAWKSIDSGSFFSLKKPEMFLRIRRLISVWIAVGGIVFLGTSHLPAADISSTGKHCLWRIANAPAPCYLLGSVHALRPSDYQRTPAIEEAIKQSQQFFFEFDPKQDEAFAKKLADAAKYPKAGQIREKINPKTYAYLHKITLSGMNDWQHLRPWAVAVLLLQHPGYGEVSLGYGMDDYVARKARYFSKITNGLETVD